MPVHSSARRSRRLAKTLLQKGFWPPLIQDHLIRRMVQLPAFPADTTFSLARSSRDLDAAFSLVYQAYRQEDITPRCPSGRRITLFHALPSTAVLVAKTRHRVLATATIIRDNAFGLPSDHLTDLSSFRQPGKTLAEISSLALQPDIRGRAKGLLFHLIRFMIHFSRDSFGVRRFVISVHPRHLPLYRGLFLFTPLPGRPRSHGFANNAPAVVAVRDLDTAEAQFKGVYAGQSASRDLYRFLFAPLSSEYLPAMEIPDCPTAGVLSPDMLDLFFRQKSDVLTRACPETLATLGRLYPGADYRKVLAASGLSLNPKSVTPSQRRLS